MTQDTIAIVGGGWFGCHLATVFQSKGIPFELFESKSQLFQGASGFNQNRLHLGFHYPRSSETRQQSREGFDRFLKAYPTLSGPIPTNLYAVCSTASLTDFETYKLIMRNSGLSFLEARGEDYGLSNIDGCVLCGERVIHTNHARKYFAQELEGSIRYRTTFTQQMAHDYKAVVNCTYQAWHRCLDYELLYEPCVTFIYESPQSIAITVMDGPFYSIYPFQDELSTLYSVEHSRLTKCHNADEALARLQAVKAEEIRYMRNKFEDGIAKFYPDFHGMYRFEAWHGSIRSCPVTGYHSRVCHVSQEGNLIHVMSGKIDSIFHAEEEVLRCLGF